MPNRSRNASVLGQLLNSDMVGMLTADLNSGKVTDCNSAFSKMLGYSRKDVLSGKVSWSAMTPPEFASLNAQNLEGLRTRGTVAPYEKEYFHKDGHRVPVLIGATLTDPENGICVAYILDLSDRRNMEAELSKSVRKISTILENITDAFFALDKDECFTYVNKQAENLLGRRREELLGKKIWEEFKEDADLPFLKEYRRAMQEQVSIDFEEHYPSLDKWLKVHVSPSEEGISVYFSDVSDTRTQQEEAELTNERMSLAQRAAKAGTFDWNIKENSITWTKELEALYGLKPGEFRGDFKHWMELIHPDDQERARKEVKRAVRIGIDLDTEFRIRWKDGTVRWLAAKATLVKDRKGKGVRLIGINMDVTERKRTEEALRDSEDRFRSLVEGITDYAVYMLDLNGRIISWNLGAERMKGYSEDEIMGQHYSIFHPQDAPGDVRRYVKVLEKAAKQGRYEEEGWRIKKDGTRFWANLIITPLKDEAGVLRGYAKIVRDMTERKRAEELITHQAYHDALTGLPNRILLQDRLQLAISHTNRSKGFLAVLFLDLDRFKNINDTLGHQIGDQLLQQVAIRIQGALRGQDTVARFGGDEFVVLLPDIPSVADVETAAKKIVEALSPHFDLGERPLHINTSIGIALYPKDGKDVQTLFKSADTALYHAKEQGRNGYRFFNADMNLKAERHVRMEANLREALSNGELQVYYQPIIDMKTRKLAGAEALLRWEHPELGVILPSEFIPIAEESGIILSLGEKVVGQACDDMAAWKAAGLAVPKVSINLSARQFLQPYFIEGIENILKAKHADSNLIEFEMTESVAMHDVEDSVAKMRKLKDLGCSLSIDDFGSGYSSLTYLKNLPIDRVKIDRSFIKYCTSDEMDSAIIQAISSMAHKLGLRVTAEGVETQEQMDYLCDIDCCDLAQGFFLSEAVPAKALAKLIAGNRTWK